jgi:hypothetical protein
LRDHYAHRKCTKRALFHRPKKANRICARDPAALEYLSRWILANEVFQEDVRLESVILWDDGLVSLSISQPQYHGRPATSREIESNLIRDGWTLCSKEASGTVFYNYAHKVLAVDVLPRNCYMNEGSFLPFDVILQRPGLELEDFLELY